MAILPRYTGFVGDPGFFSFIKKGAKAVAGAVGGVIGSPLGSLALGVALPGIGGVVGKGIGVAVGGLKAARAAKLAGQVGGVVAGAGLPAPLRFTPPFVGRGAATRLGLGRKAAIAGAGAATALGVGSLIGGEGGRRYRRMNACNPRALRRAVRRVCAAEKMFHQFFRIKKTVRSCKPRGKSCR